MKCASCGTQLPAGAHFCMKCGHAVGPAPAPLSGERKILTALFADVVGSTSLAEQMDAEDWIAIMNGAFERLSHPIERYEGTVVRLLGDAMLAFFGAPVVHEDDPARAVRAALEMIHLTEAYASEVLRSYGIPFAIRVGVNTGPVVVGAIGSDLHTEYTAMGDAVNLAARLQSSARPMTALISEHTYRFVAPLFDLADLGPIDVKGKSESVRVYEVRAVKSEPGQVRGLVGLSSPMVGRAAELVILLGLVSSVRDGAGRVALIVGEPGLGKSRLIAEWQAAATSVAPSLQWAVAQCLSYGQGLAYHLVLDLLRSLIGVPAAAPEAETRSALYRRCDDLFGEAALDVYPYLAHLLSLQLSGGALERVQLLDPQALWGRYLAALRQLLQTMASRHPLALVLEDVHWADPTSVDMLGRLLPLVHEQPLLFCFVTRPDHEAPGWNLVQTSHDVAADRLAEIQLTALSEADSRALVAHLLEIESLPENIRSAILRKAEGNPFFVEEVIRMLIDRGAIHRRDARWVADASLDSLTIPDSLHGLLLARIDRLPEDAKHTLRVASVIGRQFPATVLEQVLSSRE